MALFKSLLVLCSLCVLGHCLALFKQDVADIPNVKTFLGGIDVCAPFRQARSTKVLCLLCTNFDVKRCLSGFKPTTTTPTTTTIATPTNTTPTPTTITPPTTISSTTTPAATISSTTTEAPKEDEDS